MRNENNISHFDIVIVGGGMVGLCLALKLSIELPEHLSIALLDASLLDADTKQIPRKNAAGNYDARVSAITYESEHVLTELGAWSRIVENRHCEYRNMQVWDGAGTGSISFSADEVHQSHLGCIVENRYVVAALLAVLKTRGRVTLLPEMQFEEFIPCLEESSEFSHLVKLKGGKEIRCNLLVGADGGLSRIREQAGFKTREWDYGHQAIVATVKTQRSHDYTARQVFLPEGPLAFLPLLDTESNSAGQHYCSIVWSCIPERAEYLLGLEDDAFLQELTASFEHKLGAVIESGPRFSFPLWQRHATSYVKSGVALVGDAAHTIHPLAGQGVNLGFQDIEALGEVLFKAAKRGDILGSERVLSRYQRQRKPVNLGMMAAMEGFKRVFGSDDLLVRWLRNSSLSGVDKLPAIKQQFIKRAMGL